MQKKSSAPIIAIGTALVLIVALFTGIATYKIVEHINAGRDEARAAAMTEANMRLLAESQTKAAGDVSKIDAIPVEVTVKINVVDERENGSGMKIEVPGGYTVGDMINVNGEWFIIAKPDKTGTTPDDKQTSDGEPTGTPDQTGNNSGNEGNKPSDAEDTNIDNGQDSGNPEKVVINGETYIKVNPDGSNTPVDSEEGNKQGNDGDVDKPVENPSGDTENPDGKDTDKPSDNETDDEVIPYIGADYVTIDADGNMVYLVKRGDTLTKVSRLTGYSVQELAEYNHIKNVDLIYTGQSLRIPASPEAYEYVRAMQEKA